MGQSSNLCLINLTNCNFVDIDIGPSCTLVDQVDSFVAQAYIFIATASLTEQLDQFTGQLQTADSIGYSNIQDRKDYLIAFASLLFIATCSLTNQKDTTAAIATLSYLCTINLTDQKDSVIITATHTAALEDTIYVRNFLNDFIGSTSELTGVAVGPAESSDYYRRFLSDI